MKLPLLILASLWITVESFSQGLPRGLSDDERQMIERGLFQPTRTIPGEFTIAEGLPDDPRTPAEWEEMEGIVIAWTSFPAILAEIVRYAKEECTVYIVTENETSTRTYLENQGIDITSNVEFIDADINTVWIRDYGPNSAYLRDVDSLVFVDWIYNRPRPDDDLIPIAVGNALDIPVYSTTIAPQDLVHTGGNFMSDGNGRGFSSNLVLDENGPGNQFGASNHDEIAVNAIMQEYMGIDDYAKMTVLPFDAIHHIDMHMKLLDESTLLVGKYPDGIADGPQIEANLQYIIESFKQQTGKPYKVVRIPMPPDQGNSFPDQDGDYRTYANALFVNKTILVPVYEEQYDSTALRIWRETMPGYRVVGIECDPMIWQSGAIHCITKEIGVHRPLWISHFQPESFTTEEPHVIGASILHLSGIAEAWYYYRVAGTATYDSLQMSNNGDIWTVELPSFVEDTDLEYYFRAVANDGKEIVRPLPAPEGYFRVHVEAKEISGADPGISKTTTQRVYPNPASALTCVELTIDEPGIHTVFLTDVHGRVIETLHQGMLPSGTSNLFFHAGEMEAGFYVVHVVSEQQASSTSLIVR